MARFRSVTAMLAGCLVAVALETALCHWALNHRPTDAAMVYLLGVVLLALRFGYGASLLGAALSIACFDFFFIRPYFSFAVEDRAYLLTFLIMLVVALLVSNVAARVRREAGRTSALALERARLAEEAQFNRAEIENTRLHNALLSSVSHDLRTPLAVIQGGATALLEATDVPRERQREYLRTIAEEAGRLNRLVGNLLHMTALQAGALSVRKSWHPLEEVVGVALNRLDELLGDRPVDVQIASDAALVPADETLLQQVIVNLVENAARYTPVGTPIRIVASRGSDGVRIEVDDDGPGVPEGQEEAIFEKFRRATTTGGGMGLGLTICRGIVVAHKGKIWVENRREGGASFRIVLPVDIDAPAIKVLPEAHAESPGEGLV